MSAHNFSVEQLRKMDSDHHLHPFTDHQALHREGVRMIGKGEGAFIFDMEGKAILDGMAGLWCVNIGYGREELAKAAYGQMKELAYYNTFFKTASAPAARLAREIAERAPDSINYVFFGSSGSESNDSAIRTLRRYWQLEDKPEKNIIISRHGAYHGSTIAAASMGGMEEMHKQLGGSVPGFEHIMRPYDFELKKEDESMDEFGLRAAKSLEDAILTHGAEKIAAFAAEPIQGAGGVIIPPKTYWPEIQRICRKYDVLLLLDEVITGFGRTGEWFAAQSMGIEPDMMTIAKGLTSGYLPLSAVLVCDRIAERIIAGGDYFHGYTYSGHPVACAVALENIALIEREGLIEKVRENIGPYLLEKLRDAVQDHPLIGQVRGFGFLAALEIVKNKETRERFDDKGTAAALVRDMSIEEGLMMRAVDNAMILSPPLIWDEKLIDQACAMIEAALNRAYEKLAKGAKG